MRSKYEEHCGLKQNHQRSIIRRKGWKRIKIEVLTLTCHREKGTHREEENAKEIRNLSLHEQSCLCSLPPTQNNLNYVYLSLNYSYLYSNYHYLYLTSFKGKRNFFLYI